MTAPKPKTRMHILAGDHAGKTGVVLNTKTTHDITGRDIAMVVMELSDGTQITERASYIEPVTERSREAA